MPTPLIKQFADEAKRPISEVEELWEKAKTIAQKTFKTKDSRFYAYTVGILKNMLSLSSSEPVEDVGGFVSESLAPSRKKRKKIRLQGAIKGRAINKDDDSWWHEMSRKRQLQYIKAHPKMDPRFKHMIKPKKKKEKLTIAPKEEKQDILPEEPKPEITDTVKTEEGDDKEQVHDSSVDQQPKDLKDLTPKGRGIIHRAVNDGLKSLTHVMKEKKETFHKGFGALKKYGEGGTLSNEDKEHLKDMATIVMGAVLVSAIAFGPFVPYSGAMTQMYLDHLSKRKEQKERKTEEGEEPEVVNEPEIEDFSGSDPQMLHNLSHSMVEWTLDDHESKLKQAKSMTENA